MIIQLINSLQIYYPVHGNFTFNNVGIANCHAQLILVTNNVPNTVGLYFIYAPNPPAWNNNLNLNENINGINYCLIYVGKTGMNQHGVIGIQGMQGRIRNVGGGNQRRSIIWTNEMINHGVNHFYFKWIETSNALAPGGYDNSFWIEKSFYNLWKAAPRFKPELNV